MSLRFVTHDDLSERDSVLDAADSFIESIEDLRERLKRKGDSDRAANLRAAIDAAQRAKAYVEREWK